MEKEMKRMEQDEQNQRNKDHQRRLRDLEDIQKDNDRKIQEKAERDKQMNTHAALNNNSNTKGDGSKTDKPKKEKAACECLIF